MKTLRNLVFLPGRLVIRWLDNRKAANGVGPLNTFQRGAVHAFLGLVAFVLLVNITVPAPGPAARAASTSGGTATTAPPHPTTNTPATTARISDPQPTGEQITVSRVIDGDSFELADGRTVRVLGIDSCEMKAPETYGGEQAKSWAESLLADYREITITVEPDGPDIDRYGQLLRYVQVDGEDFGVEMVKWDHTGIYDPKDNDASAEYLAQLYAADLEYAANPPAGRDCSDPVAEYRNDSGGAAGDGDDDNMPDGALTGGYCARKWWC